MKLLCRGKHHLASAIFVGSTIWQRINTSMNHTTLIRMTMTCSRHSVGSNPSMSSFFMPDSSWRHDIMRYGLSLFLERTRKVQQHSSRDSTNRQKGINMDQRVRLSCLFAQNGTNALRSDFMVRCARSGHASVRGDLSFTLLVQLLSSMGELFICVVVSWVN